MYKYLTYARRIILGFFCGVLLLIAGEMRAQTIWTVTTAGTWNGTAVWAHSGSVTTETYPGETAGNNDQITIATGQTITLNFSATTNSITSIAVNGTGSLVMGANNLTINGTSGSLTGTGSVTISTGTLTTGGNCSVKTLTCSAASTINVAGNWGVTTFTPSTSTVIFDGTAQTISTAGPFDNFKISTATVITLGSAITIGGSFTNNAASTLSGAFGVTFTGAAQTIGGTNGTAFPNALIIASGATITLDNGNTYSAAALTFNASAAASSLTHNTTETLNVSGTVTINQPSAAATSSWNVNAGTATCGALTYMTTTAGRINQTVVTTGSLTIGTYSLSANGTIADEILSLTGAGSITVTNAVTIAFGTVTLTGAGTIKFNGLVTHTGGTIKNAATAGTYNFAGGYNLSTGTLTTLAGETIEFGGSFTNSFVGGTVFNAASTEIFTNTATITPTTAITFGNLTISNPVTITLGGAITVAGNWTNNAASTLSGTNSVTFSGAGKTIGGTNGTAFPGTLIIASGASPSLSNGLTYSAPALTFTASAAASSLTHSSTETLNVSGTVTVNQPTANATTSWNVNAGTASCGTLSYQTATAARINQTVVTSGSLTIGTYSQSVNATIADEILSVTGTGSITVTNGLTINYGTVTLTGAGSITFNGAVNHTGGTITNAGTAGTYNFKGGYTLGAGTLTTMAAETINFGGSLTNSTAALVFNATSTEVFTAAATITPTAAITFGNFKITGAVTVDLAGNIIVAGNWTNNAASTLSGTGTVTFSGAAKTIGGTNGTTFPGTLIIASSATISLANGLTYSAPALTFTASAAASSLTHSSTETLNVSGAVTVNQPTANATTSWNVNAGTASCGTLSYQTTTAARINQTVVTSGSLTIGTYSQSVNATIADEILSLTGAGSITVTNPLTINYGTVTMTGPGTITFNGLVTHTGGTITNAGMAGTYNFKGGYTLGAGTLTTLAGETINFGGSLTNSTAALIFNAASTEVFTATATIIPTAAITFGNFEITNPVTISLGGAITVAGNWTNNAASTLSGANTVTFSGAGKTIGGTNGTAFPSTLIVASGASPSLSNGLVFSASALTFTASATASSLTHSTTEKLTITGTVTINQPTAAATSSWNVNGGTASCGTLSYQTVTAGRINQTVVSTGSLTISTFSLAANATAADEVLSLTGSGSITVSNALALAHGTISLTGSGKITFNGLVTHSAGIIQNTGTAGTYNFAAGYTLTAGTLTTMSGETLEFGGNFTNSTSVLTLNSGSASIFTATSALVQTQPITFGTIQINSAVTVSIGNALAVAGNWVNNGGTLSGAFPVTFSGSSKTIGGSSGTAFPGNVIIASGASYSLTGGNTYSAPSLSFTASATNSSLTHNSTETLNISGTVTINQPTAAATTSWNINGGTATCANLTYSGTNTTSGLITQAVVTSGSLTITSLNLAVNTTNTDQVLNLNGSGTISIVNALTQSAGVISNTTTGGTINFEAGYTLTSGTLTTISGETIEFGGNFTNSTNQLTINSGCTSVFTASSVITATAAITFGTIQMNSGVTLTPPATLTLTGNFVNNGTSFVEGTGLVQFSGTGTETIGGSTSTTFYNMAANGASGVVNLNATATLINQLAVQNNATFNTNSQSFTLLSTSTINGNTLNGGGTAQIGDLTNGTFTGNVNYQRHVNGFTDWRTIGWPIQGQTISAWTGGYTSGSTTSISTTGFSGSSDPSFSFVSVYTYNYSTQSYVAATNTSNSISAYGSGGLNGGGVYVYVGNTSPGTVMSPEVTLLSTGAIISGSHTAAISNVSGDYTLLANPYPAPLSFANVLSANSGLANYYYVYDENSGGFDVGYAASGSPSTRINGIIANGQAFYAVSNGTASSVNFAENQKSNTADGNFLKVRSVAVKKMQISISGTETPYTSTAYLQFASGYTNAYNVMEDAVAMKPWELNAPTITSYSSNGKNLILNNMAELTQSIDVPVRTTVGVSGTYTLTIRDRSDITGVCVILEDKLTGSFTDLNSNLTYAFTISDTTQAPRFILHFSVPMNVSAQSVNPTSSTANNGMIIAKPSGNGPWTYTLKDNSGTLLRTEKSNAADTFKLLSANPYILDITAATGGCADQFEQSFQLVSVDSVSVPAGIQNPVRSNEVSILLVDHSIFVSLSFAEPANGLVAVYDLTGQCLMQTSFSSNQSSVRMDLPVSFSQGIYLVRVESAAYSVVRKIYLR